MNDIVKAATMERPAPTGGGEEIWAHGLNMFDNYAFINRIEDPLKTEIRRSMLARRGLGLRRYGTVLKIHNGRNAAVDAYQEALDLYVYLNQLYREGEGSAEMLNAALVILVNLAREIKYRGKDDALST